jgi:hypothetical protein
MAENVPYRTQVAEIQGSYGTNLLGNREFRRTRKEFKYLLKLVFPRPLFEPADPPSEHEGSAG